MSATLENDWHTANQRYLTVALEGVRAALERHAAGPDGRAGATPPSSAVDRIRQAMPRPPALDAICEAFELSPFERDVLLLCAGVELDSAFGPLCAAAQGDPNRPYPTFGLALSALSDPHWSAITPGRPLRRWLLIEADPHGQLTRSPLRIDERVLHYLTGVEHVDERLAGIVESVQAPNDLVPSYRSLAERVAAVWSGQPGGDLPAVELRGPDPAGAKAVAVSAAGRLGFRVLVMPGHLAPGEARELDGLTRLLERESVLSMSALLIEDDEGDERTLGRLIDRISAPLFISGRERRRRSLRPTIVFDVPRPSRDEQRGVWRRALASVGVNPNGELDAVVSEFSMTPTSIRDACTSLSGTIPEGGADRMAPLWDVCRVQCRPELDGLAQRLEPGALWQDLVLPRAQEETLREIAVQLKHRILVYEEWGFAGRSSRGLGISALFAGPSGTGKTMAAEVLANDVRLDLYRIDLSQVVSKYIGETEKNLRRVFDAAEEGGTILLFDEADALFGKRTEVRDSHDRYANIEVSYLLQRMEAYRGLAILTTNMKDALDPAFLRRIRFIVQFPFPNETERTEIWRKVFPKETPTEDLDVRKLARLNVAGGTIRNIALRAAFLAAADAAPVRMAHLARAARGEFAKLERPLMDAEIGGWR